MAGDTIKGEVIPPPPDTDQPDLSADPHQFGRDIGTFTAEALRAVPPGEVDAAERVKAIGHRADRAMRTAAAHRQLFGASEHEAAIWLGHARKAWAEAMEAERAFISARVNHDAPKMAQ